MVACFKICVDQGQSGDTVLRVMYIMLNCVSATLACPVCASAALRTKDAKKRELKVRKIGARPFVNF